MSEKVSLLYDRQEFTANPTDGGVEYFKQINAKMISYNLTFEIAWNIRNNIR
jgi:hypothetical protein